MPRSEFVARYGPWALVTGAAQGLGASFCAEIVARGLALVALDHDREALSHRVELLRAGGAEVEALVLDLADPDLEAQLDAGLAGREIGLLINNAAVSRAAPLFDQELESLRRIQRVNCEAPLLLTRILGAPMRDRGRGGIVLVSSLSALTGAPLVAHYAATKAFAATLAEGLHEELREHGGVDVSTVLAPLMDTPGMRATEPTRLRAQLLDPRRVARATLDGLGRQARIVVGRDGRITTSAAWRLLPHGLVRRLVARQVWAMYPDRAPHK